MIFDFLKKENFRCTSKVRLLEFCEVTFYNIPKEKQPSLWEDLDKLNSLFRKHNETISYIRDPYIYHVCFDPNIRESTVACEIPKTRTGRSPKYSHWVSFQYPPEDFVEYNTFGEIFYFSTGMIGKAEICFWRDRKLYVVEFRADRAQNLFLWRVYKRQEGATKLVIFESSQE